MSLVNKIDHIAIATDSISKSLDFFEKQLHLKVERIETLTDRGIRVAFIPIGDTRLELIEPLHEQSEISAFLKKRGPGLHHIALDTQDTASSMAHMQADGCVFTTQAPTTGAHASRVAFVHPKSSNGVLVELTQKSHLS